MRYQLEDDYGRPWTASASLGWLTLLAVLTCGIAAPLLGIYLSLWIRRKGRSIWPLAFFSFPFASFVISYPLGSILPHSFRLTDLLGFSSILWIAGAFSLRHEIQRYYREKEGWEIEIGPFFTFFFSVLYINYCLNPVTFKEKNPTTTLNLRK
jgi:MFS family permease